MESEARAVLRLTDVVKTFPGVVALGGVSLEVVEGEVHALLGENGAGKSTLMAVAAGALTPNSGSIEIGGQLLDEPTPARAQALGLSVVYQHTSVLDDLTVAENLLYCVPAARRSAARSSKAWVQEQLATVGAEFDSRMRVSDLTVAQRQLVEIAKALALKPKVLVLDEPTEALTAVETERLFLQIARIKAVGTAVVYISHRLPEVRRIADRISILRDGQFRGTFSAAGVSEGDILALIIGRSVEHAYPAKMTRRETDQPVLVAKNIRGDRLQGVDVEVWPGEVLGLAGVEGNGQRDFIRGLAGLTAVSGEITVKGASCGDLGSCRGAERGHHLSAWRPACGRTFALPLRSRESDAAGARYADAFRAGLARTRTCAGRLLWLLACDQGAVAGDNHLESVWRQPAESSVCAVDGRQSGRIPGG